MEFLKKDLQHLFDDQGIDKSQYDDVVEFRDPITQYNNASGTTGLHTEQQAEAESGLPTKDSCNEAHVCAGYMFNIGMLKRVFNPTFELHDIKQTGENEATTRWYVAACGHLHA